MGPVTGTAVYFIIWWLTLFMVLPFGVRAQGGFRARGEIARVARAYADGVEEPRGFADVPARTASPEPAWLRGVYDGGRSSEPDAARDETTGTRVEPAYEARRSAAHR